MSARTDFLPSLTSKTRVSADAAFIDRIQLDIGEWALFGPQDSICAALTAFSHSSVQTAHGEILPLFNGHIVENLYGIRKLKFNGNPNTDSTNKAKSLVSGSVKLANWRFSKTAKQPNELARITFATQLNLTRFTQAQHLKRRSRLDRPRLVAGYVLAIDPDQSWYADEAPLRPATNLIIGSDQKYRFALKQTRPQQLSRYLKLVRGMLSRVMLDAFQGERATYERFAGYSLKEIEFYWEFNEPNPIDYVEGLRTALMGAGENFSERIYKVDQVSFELQGQSPCLKVRVTRDIQIKVYAKTNRRVRFEVTLKNDAINRAVGSRTTVSLSRLVEKIPDLSTQAAIRLNDLLQSIETIPPPKSSLSSVQLLHAITRAADDPHIGEAIIASLVTYGRITPHNNDLLRDTIQRLVKLGILRNKKHRSKIYVVTDEYLAALQRLREFR